MNTLYRVKRDRLLNNLLESQIIKIWQHQLLDRTQLVTEGGEVIQVIYPGRINDDRGADFRNAVIATGGGVIKGDIEIHVKSSDWQAHQHHRDPVYNRVILHVVMWRDTEAATNLQNGGKVPTIALHRYISPISQLPDKDFFGGVPCLKAGERLTKGAIGEFLDNAGEERFLAKAARFRADVAQVGASQALYAGIMGALGYSKNKTPFLELARRLPLQVLESMAQGGISDEECLARQQALLLGTAGLLTSQRPNWRQHNKLDDEWIDKLERLWALSSQTKAMSWDDWHLFKVRPNNFPLRRLVAVSYLILGYRERGIFEEVVNMIKEAPVRNGHYRLEKGLVVTADGYWASYFDFGLGSRVKTPTLLGRRRAADIVVNVLLPFTHAWGGPASQPGLEQKALALYRSYPKLVINTVEKHMKNQLGLGSHLINSARRQQGLIHIYNTLCTQGKCHCCPLSHLEAGDHIQI